MARAGHCSICGTDVYLTEAGGCPAGHGAGCITKTWEAPDHPATAVPPVASGGAATATASVKKSKKRAVLIVAIVAAVVVVMGVVAMFGAPLLRAAAIEQETHAALRARTLDNGQTMDSLVEDIHVDGNAVTIWVNLNPVQFGAIGHPGGVVNENIGIQDNCHAYEKAVLDKIPQVVAVRVCSGNSILDTVVRASAVESATAK